MTDTKSYCKLRNDIHEYDLCATNVDAYADYNVLKKYLGKGILWKVQGRLQEYTGKEYHFWKKL